ncbi:CPBP family intramembrane glutamic endopeptidase [Natronocella acetinitrilica]|nr:type II CAAX endopeptidase family protein [Natronocella acetinitrilica]
MDLLLVLLLTVGAGIIAALFAARGGGASLLPMIVLQGGLILLGMQLLLWRRGQRWRSLGLVNFRLQDVPLGLLALGIVFVVNLLLSGLLLLTSPDVLSGHQQELAGVADWLVGGHSLWTLLAITFFIGFYEEVLARGFILNRCQVLFPGVWAPVILSSVLFGLGHLYQGWFGVVQTAVIGLVFARLMVRWGSLWPLILAHTGLNFASLSVFRLLGAE